jgi:ribonuclease-3
MITPAPVLPTRRTEPGLRPAFTPLVSARSSAQQAERRAALAAFLEQLGLSPGGRDLAAVDEALTHTSAGLSRNHERLEFLGDAVLRLAAAEFLQQHHPTLTVGQASSLRAQLVSDRWLAELAERCGLHTVLRIGPMAVGDQAGRATVRAECCEALIGAIYTCWGGATGGLGAVHAWLDGHWRQEVAVMLADPHRHNWKSALQEFTQGQGWGLPSYSTEQMSTAHGDPRRFRCQVSVAGGQNGEGWGRSRRDAEQAAAEQALKAQGATPDRGS